MTRQGGRTSCQVIKAGISETFLFESLSVGAPICLKLWLSFAVGARGGGCVTLVVVHVAACLRARPARGDLFCMDALRLGIHLQHACRLEYVWLHLGR